MFFSYFFGTLAIILTLMLFSLPYFKLTTTSRLWNMYMIGSVICCLIFCKFSFEYLTLLQDLKFLNSVYRGISLTLWTEFFQLCVFSVGDVILPGSLLETFASIYNSDVYASIAETYFSTYNSLQLQNSFFVVDTMTLCFLALVAFIFPVIFCTYNPPIGNLQWHGLVLFSIYAILLVCFVSANLFWFYFFFECIWIPTYVMISWWGSRGEKIYASYAYTIFTMAGSVFFLIALLAIGHFIGSFSIFDIYTYAESIPFVWQSVIWWSLVMGFAIKVPMYGLHSWLTVAHVEAPTVGSVILASLLLKLGGYGILRFVFGLFPNLTVLYANYLIAIAFVGFSFAAIFAFVQTDLKRFVAYTSISHMNFFMVCMFTFTKLGFTCGLLGMFSHGLISTGLFMLVGILYDRYKVRSLPYFGALASILPVKSFFLAFFLLANGGFPFLSGFTSEFLGYVSIMQYNIFLGIFAFLGFIMTGAYTFVIMTKLLFGPLQPWYVKSERKDLSKTELSALVYLATLVLVLGIFPNYFLIFTDFIILPPFRV